MGRFIGIEIGNSAYTEVLMKNGEFRETEDGIFLGDVEAEDEGSAYEALKNLDYNKERVFGRVLLFEVKKGVGRKELSEGGFVPARTAKTPDCPAITL